LLSLASLTAPFLSLAPVTAFVFSSRAPTLAFGSCTAAYDVPPRAMNTAT